MKACLRGIVTTLALAGCGPLISGQVSNGQVSNFKPITDAVLENPDPADWVHWRRTLDNWGYSPLNQITRDNVGGLQLVWGAALPAGPSEAGPLEYNGVMYVPSPNGGVVALDATNGRELWKYKKDIENQPPPPGGWGPFSVMRSLAIYDDKIYVTTHDAHIVALNARNGKVVWDQKAADYMLGYRYTSGAIAVKGKIVAGMSGCDRYKNDVCFISAYDAQTGKEVWRTSTIARPGEPGGNTWGNLPLNFRAGGDVWIPGSYDSRANLMYWSASQPKPWARISRGTDGDALYTNSVLALDPETGKIVWYHQLIPGETHDLDEVFENILIDHDNRSALFKMGKPGVLWEIDRKTGGFLSAHDLGYQNVFDVDKETGKVTYRPDMIPKPDTEITFCPGFGGVRNWRAMAYHPETQAFYIPISPACLSAVFSAVDKVDGGAGSSVAPWAGERNVRAPAHPKNPDRLGSYIAMDSRTGKVIWQQSFKAGPGLSALATAGGLIIGGDTDHNVYVYDAANGKILFHTRLAGPLSGTPITYTVSGRQYLAIPVASAGSGALGGIGTPSNAIFTFALPERAAGDSVSRR